MEWAENFKGLQHIGIPTNDMDKTVEFYKKIGFEVAHETKDGDVRVVFLKAQHLDSKHMKIKKQHCVTVQWTILHLMLLILKKHINLLPDYRSRF